MSITFHPFHTNVLTCFEQLRFHVINGNGSKEVEATKTTSKYKSDDFLWVRLNLRIRKLWCPVISRFDSECKAHADVAASTCVHTFKNVSFVK